MIRGHVICIHSKDAINFIHKFQYFLSFFEKRELWFTATPSLTLTHEAVASNSTTPEALIVMRGQTAATLPLSITHDVSAVQMGLAKRWYLFRGYIRSAVVCYPSLARSRVLSLLSLATFLYFAVLLYGEDLQAGPAECLHCSASGHRCSRGRIGTQHARSRGRKSPIQIFPHRASSLIALIGENTKGSL